MRKIIVIMILLFSAGNLLAQSGNKLTMTVNGADAQPAENATASLYSHGKLFKIALADARGNLLFENLPADSFTVKISAAGYEEYKSALIVLSTDVNLPAISLVKNKTTDLAAVTVTAKKPFIQRLSDRLVVNVEGSIVSTGSSALEILEKAPGVTVDRDDNISLKGRTGVLIMIDGKPTPMSGADLANYLKSLPSSSIERIDLITNPSAKYDAAGNAGIIDIRLKKDQRLGTNGTVNLNYGQGVYSKANAGATFNYRNKKINIFGGFTYAYRKGLNHLYLDRRFYQNGIYNGGDLKDNFTRSPVDLQAPKIGMDFFPNAKTIFGFTANGNYSHYRRVNDNNSLVLDPNKNISSTFTSLATNNDHNSNVFVNVNYKHKFNTKGKEITADADYGRYDSKSLTTNQTGYFKTDGTSLQPDYRLDGDQKGQLVLKTAKIDYANPLKAEAKIETGLKTSFVSADNDAKFYDMSSGTAVPDVNKTNHFIYKENNNAAYFNFSKGFKKYDFQIGLRAEQTNIQTEQKIGNVKYDSSYLQLFPSAFFNYKLKEDQTLGISVSRRIDRPNYSQLNPFLFLIDPTTYNTGAPGLLPQFTWAYELNYTIKQMNFSLGYSHTTNDQNVAIAKFRDVFPNIPSADNVTVQIPVNLKSSENYSVVATMPFKIKSWWNINTNASVFYQQYNGSLGTTQLNSGKPTFSGRLTNNFSFKKGWSAELSGAYDGGGQYGFMVTNAQWALNAGVQQTILKNKGTLRFNITDIFRTNGPGGLITYDNYVEKWHAVRETRVGTISFNYRFGSNKVEGARRRATASEEERQRAQ